MNETTFPAFFDEAPTVTVHDPLAEFLGAARGGIIEYRYADAVRLAGHSCPTVAAAYLMTRAALRALHPDALPRRGDIAVAFREKRDAGVTGVMAAVTTLLTGAADEGGFKGLGGRFVRRDRLAFGADIAGEVRYRRLDGEGAAEVSLRLDRVPGNPRMGELLPRCVGGVASAEEMAEFQALWQDRVRRLLLDHADDPEVFIIEENRS